MNDDDNVNDDSDVFTNNVTQSNTISPALVSGESEEVVVPPTTTATTVTVETASSSSFSSSVSYVNHGYEAWELNRQRWLQKNSGGVPPNQPPQQQRHAKPINVDEIIDAIFTSHKTMLNTANPKPNNNSNSNNDDNESINITSSNMTAPFPQAVPLPQLIDILQDLWEAESL
jgi:hypothetical protein